YKEINLQALKMIKSGGYLLTFSCSQHMTPDLFMEMIKEAAADAKRDVQFIDFKIQAPDHPALLSGKEQLYLKCMVLRVK
ncbi:MAG: rRNA large subunit methyltransferase I, partial [Anaeroplasmataceae bacterium]|nr:rRNA large subunit methyltransferase I [Anaeroplasmataceae bacterium]